MMTISKQVCLPTFILVSVLLCAFNVSAEPKGMVDAASNCFLNLAASSSPDTTIAELTENCQKNSLNPHIPTRFFEEKISENNRFVITPHQQNYILPFTHNDSPNQQPWQDQNTYPGITDPVQHKEAKLQISFKVPLNEQPIFFENDGVYLGFTLKSFWQVYNHQLSAPFRETNYRPELFYQAPISSSALGGAWLTRIGIEHESNGRSQLLSRSWNRIYMGLGFLKGRWAIFLQPWYRLPEDAKVDDGDAGTPLPPKGDDNPDIADYLGHYELLGVYKYDQYEITSTTRFNFHTGYGALEMGMSFPLWGRLKGFIQYFHGYGESMIDYDQKVQRIGLGILLTDLL
jgi:phospholipase A1